MSLRLKRFWQSGYLYITSASILFLIFCRPDKVGSYDWSKELYFFQFIKLSFTNYGSFPFFWWERSGLMGYPTIINTAYFISNPESFLFSPFSPLLFILNPVIVTKLIFVIMFAFGVWGTIKLKKQLAWSNHQFRIFAGLFLFSPIIIQHLSVGYFPWINLFLAPWVFYFLAHSDTKRKILGLSMLFGLTALQGGAHPLVWFIALYGFYSLFQAIHKRSFQPVLELLLVGIGTFLLSLVRITLTFQAFSNFTHGISDGYTFQAFAKWGLIPTHFPEPTNHYVEGFIDGISMWDGGTYWGLSVFVFFMLFFVIKKAAKQDKHSQINPSAMLFAALILFVFSFYNLYTSTVYFVTSIISIPFLHGAESCAYRFSIPAFMGFTFVTSQWFPILWTRINLAKYIQRVLELQLWKKIENAASTAYQWIKEKIPANARSITNAWRFAIKISVYPLAICLVILLLSFPAKALLWGPFSRIIQNAYEGTEPRLQFLTDQMDNRTEIAFEIYLQKAENLYRFIQSNLLDISLLIIILWFLDKYLHLILSWTHKRVSSILKNFGSPQTLANLSFETILLLPMFYSSLMWMLFGTHVPVEKMTAMDYQLDPPILELRPSSTEITLNHAPDEVAISSKSSLQGSVITFKEIPYKDRAFLNIPDNAEFTEINDSLALSVTSGNEVRLSVKKKTFLLTGGLTAASWILSVLLLLRWSKTK